MARRSILSFKYAFEGIYTALKEEPNLRVHFTFAVFVILLGLIFQVSDFEWMVIVFLIGLVIALELANTAVETVVDSFTQDVHPGAKKAKDVAAASVLVASITAIIVGLLIFLPYFIILLTSLF